MKKIACLTMSWMLLASNVFALDLSQFVGTWTRETDGVSYPITITYDDETLVISDLLNGHGFDMDVLSRGSVMFDGDVPISFTAGNVFDNTYVITIHMRLSEIAGAAHHIPDLFAMISLTRVGNELRVQLLGSGWSNTRGLWSNVASWSFERRE